MYKSSSSSLWVRGAVAGCPFFLTGCFLAGAITFSEDLEPDANGRITRIGVSADLYDGEAGATGRVPAVG
jgi:hypothetical protein